MRTFSIYLNPCFFHWVPNLKNSLPQSSIGILPVKHSERLECDHFTNVLLPMQIDGAEEAERTAHIKIFVILSIFRPAFGVLAWLLEDGRTGGPSDDEQ